MSFKGHFTFDGHPIRFLKNKPSGNVQDFYSIRQKCLETKTLFEDPDFPCTDKSLFYSHPADRRYEWLRPQKICEDPQFYVTGHSRFDVIQGELGDCWFLAAVANLTLDNKLFYRVVCEDNSFEESYAGIFHFRFWQYGTWLDVVVDDRLPTCCGQLMYMHSSEKKEFWSALLEKAYAKLYGSYEALKTGSTCEALEDLTGGITEMYRLKDAPGNLFDIIEKAFEKSSMMGCSVEAGSNASESETPEGLVRGHAYSINKAVMADITTPNVTGKIPLLRLRNPWGNEIEWNGPWSDKSPQWNCVPDHVKENLGLTSENDGEFWMSYRDFLKHFNRMDVCNLSPNSLTDRNEQENEWKLNCFEGEWVAGVSSGGCRNFLETFHRNPQFVLTIDNSNTGKTSCTVVVALMQKNRRLKNLKDFDFLTIGFLVYRLKDTDLAKKPQTTEFFNTTASIARSEGFINLREVTNRFQLESGTYLIVPSTYLPNEEGEFLLRVFTEGSHRFEENDNTINIERVGYDPKTAQNLETVTKLSPDEENLFFGVCGPSKEIDWEGLQKILDTLLSDGPDIKSENITATDESQTKSRQKGFLRLISGCLPFKKESSAKSETFVTAATVPSAFSENICRSMVAMLDDDFSGKLSLDEFQILFNEVVQLKAAFKRHDKDGNQRLDISELRAAFASVGYQLNNRILNSLAYRYGSSDRTISLEHFILCAVKVKTMLQHFKKRDFKNNNEATFTVDDWITKAVYC